MSLAPVVQILVLLVLARLFGQFATACHQSSSIGEILAGVILALSLASLPFEIPLLDGIHESQVVEIIGEVGIFFLLLLTGVEMEPRAIADHSRQVFVVAAGGMLLPLCLGIAFAWYVLPDSGFKQGQALIVGIALSISAIPVAAKVFMELGLLHKPVGEVVIGAALVDDVLGLVLLAVATHLILQGNLPDLASLLWLLGQVLTFFAVALALGYFGYARIWRWLHASEIPAISLTALVLFALGLGLLADALGMHFVLGPFVAGLFFEKRQVGEEAYERVKHVISTVTLAVLAPVFFAWIGLQIDLTTVASIPFFLAALIAVAFVGKLIGAGLPAYWSGLGMRSSLAVGVGLSGRGAVELIIASIAQKSGLFLAGNGDHPVISNLFSALVITAVATTLLAPIGLRWILGGRQSAG